jgi:hypothetical protein
MADTLKCDDCGQFATSEPGSSGARMYDFAAMEPDYDHFRCKRCTERLGPVHSNARPASGDMRGYEQVY